MTFLSATSKVLCPDATALGHTVTDHLAEHGIEISPISDTTWTLLSPTGSARIIADSSTLRLEAFAQDAEMLMEMKYLLTSHVGEFNQGYPAEILWRGDGDEVASMPNVRSLKVMAIHDVSSHVRRITFASTNLKRFDTLSALHVKLLLPPDGVRLCLPRLSLNGTVDWGSEQERAIVRKYTIRRIDPSAGTLEIDFVLHDHGGPGSCFAINAQISDEIGMVGPGGGSARPADWNLFIGDETALPAIARLMEALPEDAQGTAIIEVADESDEQDLVHKANIDIRWFYRNRLASPHSLSEHAALIKPPSSGSIFAWAGTEFSEFRKIRSDWRTQKGIAKDDHLAVAYWRTGVSQV
jgi:NADPH-dependent ferric siderophore reductase